MVNKISGVFDVLSAIIIFLNILGVIGNLLVLSVIVYFIIRMIAFYGEPLCMVDGLAALILLVNLLYQIELANYIILIYLLVKGVYYYMKK